ncbi:hypothetical protein ASE01_01800 [Nocardioides sp. Root190]|uniref:gamma-glutamyl-gamma-aminobutyrate hydrolase family protein n=1 Tax=Nocardioides sp. Root190 TaxID=1736488 RepID=UPI0006F2F560|nr:gamma-glutamyl-gamma-aminobutyrate hydrolase family protein [Nocardioides sp. Root190]KRB80250.1 hypothetical protein ASE01_01800 [Nocardioides sp. Root190]
MSADPRPVIGIAGHGYDVARDFGSLPVHGTPRSYVDAVAASGGRPVVLPPGAAPDLLDLVDGIVLTGGGDVDPARYGGDATDVAGARGVVPQRDADEIALVHAALAAGVPLLGVCRGLQVLAVAAGGRLRGDIGHVHPADGHPVTTAPGSLVRRLLGPEPTTSALHRQAVVDPGAEWVATAWAADGVVEAIEPRDAGRVALGVQWHPELAWNTWPHDPTGPAIFTWLAQMAENRSTRDVVSA